MCVRGWKFSDGSDEKPTGAKRQECRPVDYSANRERCPAVSAHIRQRHENFALSLSILPLFFLSQPLCPPPSPPPPVVIFLFGISLSPAVAVMTFYIKI